MSPTITATASVQVPAPPGLVWQAVAVLGPYCPICDVSYRSPDVDGSVVPGSDASFVCIPGHDVDGSLADAPTRRGEITDWEPPRRVGTRLWLTSETWTTGIDLQDHGPGRTRVTVAVTYRVTGMTWLRDKVRRRAVRRRVETAVSSMLSKIPDHVQLMFDARE